MKVIKRYEYYGPRGLRWTEWFDTAEVSNNDEANEFIRQQKLNNGERNEEYKII